MKQSKAVLVLQKSFSFVGFPIAAFLVLYSILPDLDSKAHWSIIFTYTVLTLVCSFAPVRVGGSALTLNNSVIFSGIILYGTWVSAWSSVIELMIIAFLMRLSLPKALSNLGQILITVWIVGFVQTFLRNAFPVPRMIIDLALIGVYWFANTSLAALLIAAYNEFIWFTIVKKMVKGSAITYLLLMLLGGIGASLVESNGIVSLIPLSLFYVVISIVFHQYFSGAQKLEQKVMEVNNLNDSILIALAAAIDARDPYTHGHSNRVAHWSKEIAKALELGKNQIKQTYYGGILHDIGKIGIQDAILQKDGKLTDEEFRKIKQHPVIGYEIVQQAGVFQDLLPAIRNHHERYDGKGYPDGLRAKEIPLMARVLAVADAFDAMVSDRPYRKGLPIEVALERIKEGAGTQFDPEIAIKFIKLIKSYTEKELESIIQVEHHKTLEKLNA